MKFCSITNMYSFSKTILNLNTFSILGVYKTLNPLSEIKSKDNDIKKASASELIHIIAVRTVVMIFSALLCMFMNSLFGVVPVAMAVNATVEGGKKSSLINTAAAAFVLAAGAAAVIIHFFSFGTVSAVIILIWITLTHLVSYLAVRKKYNRIKIIVS